jgi:regulator of cell morphogenesis and NO signaling
VPYYSNVDFSKLNESEIIHFILTRYHQEVRSLFELIGDLFNRKAEVYLIPNETFLKIKKAFHLFQLSLEKHLHHEENIVFPFAQQMYEILSKPNSIEYAYISITVNSIRILANEHNELKFQLENLKHLADEYQLTSYDNANKSLLYSALKEFHNSFNSHFKLEEEILFPKLIELENKLLTRVGNNPTEKSFE